MAAHFADRAVPVSAEALAEQLDDAYRELTGQHINEATDITLPRHSHGGMSSGMISARFWRDTALPLLLHRFERHRAQS